MVINSAWWTSDLANNCVQDSDGDCVGANVLTDFDYVPGSDCESG